MDSALKQILQRANLPDHIITYGETRRWLSAEREVIFGRGLLRRTSDAEFVTCDACGDPHDLEVITGPVAQPLAYCSHVGLIGIAPERLHQWELDFNGVAGLLAGCLCLTGGGQSVIPGRVWMLGRRQLGGRIAEIFLVHGSTWPDGLALLRGAPRLQNSPAPIILCPDRLPVDPEWQHNGRALIPLTELLALRDGSLVCDIENYADLCGQIALRRERPVQPTPVENRLQVLARFLKENSCKLKSVCWWANVYRQDLNAWKLGKREVPDRGDKADRIERLLQFGIKTQF